MGTDKAPEKTAPGEVGGRQEAVGSVTDHRSPTAASHRTAGCFHHAQRNLEVMTGDGELIRFKRLPSGDVIFEILRGPDVARQQRLGTLAVRAKQARRRGKPPIREA